MTMLSEDQYMERTPDLIAKVRTMRKTAEKEMARFTRLADYDVRRIVGQKPSGTIEAIPSPPADNPPKRKTAKANATQTAIEFSPDVVEHDDDTEAQQ